MWAHGNESENAQYGKSTAKTQPLRQRVRDVESNVATSPESPIEAVAECLDK